MRYLEDGNGTRIKYPCILYRCFRLLFCFVFSLASLASFLRETARLGFDAPKRKGRDQLLSFTSIFSGVPQRDTLLIECHVAYFSPP